MKGKQKVHGCHVQIHLIHTRSPRWTINIFHEIQRLRRRIETALNQAIIGATSKYHNQGIRSKRTVGIRIVTVGIAYWDFVI